jgi:hypothetical protein
MHGNGISGGAVGTISPGVVGGPEWFEAAGRPLTVSVDVPLSVELMVAALYGTPTNASEAELADDGEVRGNIALSLVLDGLTKVEETARHIAWGGSADPGWLAFCRRRVREVIAGGWGQGAGR